MSRNKPMSVLLSPVGGQAICGIIDYFKDKGIRVVGIDRNPDAIGRFFVDRFFEIPGIGDSFYAEKIREIILEENIEVFISWLDTEILFWNERFYSSLMPPEIKKVFAFNFRRDILNYYDKFQFYQLLNTHGFKHLETFLLDDNALPEKIEFPTVIKPRTGSGSKDTYIAKNREEFSYLKGSVVAIHDNLKKFIVQKFISGIEYTIDFFSVEGNVINKVVRKRTEHRGVSLKGEVVYDDEAEKLLSDFCIKFNIDGLNNVQMIKAGGAFYILDFNPRPSGTIMLSVAAGVDFINNILEKREGHMISHYGMPKKVKMIRYLSELFYE